MSMPEPRPAKEDNRCPVCDFPVEYVEHFRHGKRYYHKGPHPKWAPDIPCEVRD